MPDPQPTDPEAAEQAAYDQIAEAFATLTALGIPPHQILEEVNDMLLEEC